MSFEINNWFQELNNSNVIHSYKGTISGDLITGLLNTVESKLESTNEKSKTKKKVYNVLVEALQNLYHHVEENPDIDELTDKKFAMFLLSKSGENYKITTGNFVKCEKSKLLKDRMEQINHLSQDELKILYKLILNNEEFSDKGGGGLGMIDIARKTGNKLEYEFYLYNEEYYFFCLTILIT